MTVWLLREGVFLLTKPTKRDLALISGVLNDDSQALENLFKTYLPMVYHTYGPYYLRLFDQDDWLQEARIVCYETCQCFDCQCDKSFGSFYKLRFQHHIHNLLRKELAQKRRIDQQAVLFDTCPEKDAPGADVLAYCQTKNSLEHYLEQLSRFELVSFQVLTGRLTAEQACQQLDCTLIQLKRGQSRCQTKLKQYYRKKEFDD